MNIQNCFIRKFQSGKSSDIYENRYNWLTEETKHFLIKYVDIRKYYKINLKNIISSFESSYNEIATFLDINIEKKFLIYLLPSKEFCIKHGILDNIAIPHLNIASINYKNTISNTKLLKTFRHELTHLIVYYWDYQMYHLELLEEGLACYLSDLKINYHKKYLQKLNTCYKKGIISDQSLLISNMYRATDYDKAASFVQFLIEHFGIDMFKKLYIASVVNRDNDIFFINRAKVPNTYLYKIIEKVLNIEPIKIQLEWYSYFNKLL